ncbi:MAG: hypothetical protein PHD68_02250 [Rugosibacter sp.]|nr:hypothetical protein [Rugosibacter sp.]
MSKEKTKPIIRQAPEQNIKPKSVGEVLKGLPKDVCKALLFSAQQYVGGALVSGKQSIVSRMLSGTVPPSSEEIQKAFESDIEFMSKLDELEKAVAVRLSSGD